MGSAGRGWLWFLAGMLSASTALADEAKLELKDFQPPEACARCHPQHYQEWRGSPHAYAAIDPLVQACNKRALKDTGGKIGDLCVRCHAPIAARTGELASGFELKDASPLTLRGVTCDTCHRMEPPCEGRPIANASFEMSAGNVYYGRLYNPIATPAHETATSEFLGKSDFCGSCHDVIHGSALIEKTFAQWSASAYPDRQSRCQDCHMLRYSGQAAEGGPFRETLHRHNFPAASIPLVRFPNRGYQAEQVKEFLRTAARMAVDVPRAAQAGGTLAFTVRVKNSGTGHNIPSGLSNERQMWIEATVVDPGGAALFRTGHLDGNGDLKDHHSALEPGGDPALVSFSDRFVDREGKEVPFLFLASGVEERSIKPLEERSASYRVPLAAPLEGSVVRVRVRLLFRSFPPHALRDLGLGHLAPELPIWEMDAFEALVEVMKELPRRTEYAVPEDFASIQGAIDALKDGDRIIVAPGEHTVRAPIDFRGKALQVVSLGGPRRTVIRYAGDSHAPEASVVVFRGGEGPGARLQGFTITGGSGIDAAGHRLGGGIAVIRSSPTIAGNRIEANEAAGGFGGGIYCEHGAPRLIDNDVLECRAAFGGGLAFASRSLIDGQPPQDESGVPLLRGGVVRGNAAESGGGIYIADYRLRAEWIEVSGNIARGGAASRGAGGIQLEGGSLALDHATVVHNRAPEGAIGALGSRGGDPALVTSSIFWANEPAGADGIFSYSIAEHEVRAPEGLASTNRKDFPMLLDPSGFWDKQTGRFVKGDYRILYGSLAIDAADPAAPLDPDDSRSDIGAYFFEQPLKAFVRGDVSGNGKLGMEDLGLLFEHLKSRGTPRCLDAADFDDNGRVDGEDAFLLACRLFEGKPRPRPPGETCGVDPTHGEGLSCLHKADPCKGDRP